MGNYIFLFFYLSAFFIVYVWSVCSKFSSLFFWNGLKFVIRENTFKNYNLYSNYGEIYECGFSGVEEPLKKVELQYLIISIFFILYEIEFLLLLPIFLFTDFLFYSTYTLIIISFFLVLFTYWYEWDYYLLHYYH